MSAPEPTSPAPERRSGSDVPFLLGLAVIGGLYVGLIVAMVVADAAYLVTDPTGRGDDGLAAGFGRLMRPLAKPEIRYALKLSLISCAITAILSVWVAVPLGYLMSRYEFRGKGVVDAVIDGKDVEVDRVRGRVGGKDDAHGAVAEILHGDAGLVGGGGLDRVEQELVAADEVGERRSAMSRLCGRELDVDVDRTRLIARQHRVRGDAERERRVHLLD